MSLEEKVSGIDNRLSVTESKVDGHTRLLNAQIEKNETLMRIEVLLERQMDDSQKRDQQMERFEETFKEINVNLTNLNSGQGTLDERVTGIENTINESKKTAFKFTLSSWKYIGSIAIGILIAILYKKLGL